MEIVFENPIHTEVNHILVGIWWTAIGLGVVFFLIHMIGRSFYEEKKLEAPRFVRLSEGIFMIGAALAVATTVTWLVFGEDVIRPRFEEPTSVIGKVESCDITSSAHSTIISVRALVDKETCAGTVEYVIPDPQFPQGRIRRYGVPATLAKLRPGSEVVFSKFRLKSGEPNRDVLFLNPD